eukprot:GFYU01006112.1.p1 GENE.GFYU01006112.1~~GFYU01006112.1.p1  ORF type:complete len:193 (-),score=39.16 GFYU01006112.1:745-1287(-)
MWVKAVLVALVLACVSIPSATGHDHTTGTGADAVLSCRHCGADIVMPHHKPVMVHSEQALARKRGPWFDRERVVFQRFENPNHERYDLVGMSDLQDENIALHGQKIGVHSWFKGYTWQIVQCGSCRHQIGWRFDRQKGKKGHVYMEEDDYDEDMPDHFYGVISESVLNVDDIPLWLEAST